MNDDYQGWINLYKPKNENMIPKVYNQKIKLTDGREIELETGKLAKLADGSVVVRMGNCMLLATVVSSRKPSPVDFLPLTVDYREKFASAGRFPGGFFKREARPSNEEILTMRTVSYTHLTLPTIYSV